jgi:hypothetical protein
MAMNTPIKTIELKKLSNRLPAASAATPFWCPLRVVRWVKGTVGVISLIHAVLPTDFFGLAKVFGTMECVNHLKSKKEGWCRSHRLTINHYTKAKNEIEARNQSRPITHHLSFIIHLTCSTR